MISNLSWSKIKIKYFSFMISRFYYVIYYIEKFYTIVLRKDEINNLVFKWTTGFGC